MRIAVAGATGLTGREVVRALVRRGASVAVIARSAGVDLNTGEGLDGALAGADALIDVTTAENAAAFTRMSEPLLRGSVRAGVSHVVLLSIVAAPRLPERPHYAGKMAQERLFASCGIPFSIVRATQYFEYGAMHAGWARQGEVAALPDVTLRPIAVSDVGDVLAEVATGAPLNGVIEVAGPDEMTLVECARRVLAARGESLRVEDGGANPDVPYEVFLPSPGARIAPTRFDDWIRAMSPAAPRRV